ncbi:MAG TPA: acetylxylan esterase [Mycobacteriales bacterium]|jgi:cephalosporin-C deacetylase|nr:acetylxylan esterase [Mycobacteriales bacterium]
MAVQFDLPLPELRDFRPELPAPAGFDEFWAGTLGAAREHELAPEFVPVDTGLALVDVLDVRFTGFGGDRVAAWLVLPRGTERPLPTVVEFIGYAGGRGLPHDHLLWAAAGYAHLVVDTRGQGSAGHSVGVTPDNAGATGPHAPGFLTMGVESPDSYFYRRVFTDAVRATEVAGAHPRLDPDRVIVTGGSQGGGITVAVAGLVPGLLGAMPDVPFLSCMRRATEITDSRPYVEITHYLAGHRDAVERTFEVLSYFDGVHFAARASAPALFSVALMDAVCPPSTVFAAYNRWAHPRTAIEVYPYNGHEGGGGFQRAAQLRFAAELLTA